MLKFVVFYKNLLKTLKNKINIFLKWLLNFLYELSFYVLTLLKYLSFLGFLGFFIYFFKSQEYNLINDSKEISILHPLKCDFFSKNYLKYEGYLLKNYIYTFKNQNIHIKSNFQKIKFNLNNNYYDENSHLIKNPITNHIELLEDYFMYIKNSIKIFNLPSHKNIKDAFKIYNFIKNIENSLNKNIKINLYYIHFRWNLILEYENKFYNIKLPEKITPITLAKIKYIETNIEKFFNKNIEIIDLRFNNLIITV